MSRHPGNQKGVSPKEHWTNSAIKHNGLYSTSTPGNPELEDFYDLWRCVMDVFHTFFPLSYATGYCWGDDDGLDECNDYDSTTK